VDATWATDPTAAKTGLLRAPNGVLQDVRTYWSAGKPYYDPARITASWFATLTIRIGNGRRFICSRTKPTPSSRGIVRSLAARAARGPHGC